MHRRAPGFHPGLMTDMYHPDSAYVSWRTGHNGLTTFDLYTRTAPFGGAYLLVAGLEAALEFVQAFRYTPEELKFVANIRDYEEAFEAISAAYNRYTLLLDTYDPRNAIHTAITVALRSQETLGHTLAAVRLDSGDLVADSNYIREQLDRAGLENVRILASGDLDE